MSRRWFSDAANFLGLSIVLLTGGATFLFVGLQRDPVLSLVSIPFFGLGGYGLVRGVSGIREQARIRRSGTEVPAVVESVTATPVPRSTPTYTLTYRYVDSTGQEHIGKVETASASEAARWRSGDVGRARYEPARPQVSAWLGRG